MASLLLSSCCSALMALLVRCRFPSSVDASSLDCAVHGVVVQLGHEVPVSKIPDNTVLLNELFKMDLLVTTPNKVPLIAPVPFFFFLCL
jgi:hypothetical protein